MTDDYVALRAKSWDHCVVVGALSVILGLRLGSPLELGSPRVLKARCIKTRGLARKGSRFKIFQ